MSYCLGFSVGLTFKEFIEFIQYGELRHASAAIDFSVIMDILTPQVSGAANRIYLFFLH
jgi:hypothetical protein